MAENRPPLNHASPGHGLLFTEGNRLRAGWRLVIQTLILFALASCLGVPVVILLVILDPGFVTSIPQIPPEALLLGVMVEAVAITVSVFLAVRFIDRRSIESLGLTMNLQSLFDILTGAGIALLQMGFIYILMLGSGWLTFEGFAWDVDPIDVVLKNTLLFLLIFILVGWSEELLSRGYHLQTLASGITLPWGILISSAVFSLFHLQNPGAGWVSTAGIFFAGVYLAYGYVRTKQLWLPIGLHIGWNFCEGVAFGFPVSGLDIYTLTRITVSGPDLWTGGRFGPEAGLIVLPALLLGGLLIYLYTMRRTR